MRFLAFDLETIPCLQVGARLWHIDDSAPDGYEQMYAARRRETEGKQETDFLKPFMHRIVGLGMVALNLEKQTVSTVALAGDTEAEYIRQFHLMLAGNPALITWNGQSFDLPVIRYRAMYHGLPLPQLYGAKLRNFDRYDYRFGEKHFDLMDVLSSYGRSPSLKLAEMAALLDIPCKTHGSGEDVLPLYRAGDYATIKAYVQEDAQVTARIFLEWWASRGSAPWDLLKDLDEQLRTEPVEATA